MNMLEHNVLKTIPVMPKTGTWKQFSFTVVFSCQVSGAASIEDFFWDSIRTSWLHACGNYLL